MRHGRKSWAPCFVAALGLIAPLVIDAAPARAQADCEDAFIDGITRYIDETFDIRRNCLEIRLRGGTCTIQPNERNERNAFADAIEESCTETQLQDFGPGGCAEAAEDGVDSFVRCAIAAARAHVRNMLAPIFGRGRPLPTPTPSMLPTPRPTCARLNQSCFGPGFNGCCAPFVCRIIGLNNEICVPSSSPSGAFLDGFPPGF